MFAFESTYMITRRNIINGRDNVAIREKLERVVASSYVRRQFSVFSGSRLIDRLTELSCRWNFGDRVFDERARTAKRIATPGRVILLKNYGCRVDDTEKG